MTNFEPNQSEIEDPQSQQTESGGRLPINDTSMQSRYYIRMSKPTWMRILLGLNIAVFILVILFGIFIFGDLNLRPRLSTLVFFGAKVNEFIAEGEVWRLFTAMFLHGDIIHLLFNLYALYILGPMVEGFFGHRRFLLIYFIGGLWGSVASYAFSQAISVGASGAIFGLIGATTIYFLRYRENFGPRGRAIVQNMLVVIGINLVLGLSVPGIDNWGHMGGLIGGTAVAYTLLPIYRAPATPQLGAQPLVEEERNGVEWLWVVGHLALLVLAVQQISGQYV